MKPEQVADIAVAGERPIGHVRPASEPAVRALNAVRANRYADARRHLDALPADGREERAWALYLRGLLALAKNDLGRALGFFRAGLDVFEPEAMPEVDNEPDVSPFALWAQGPAGLRLRAAIMEKLGWVLRRQDQPEAATKVHLDAYHMRERHGSYEELWETAVSLGHDAQLAGQTDAAERWFEAAVANGAAAQESPRRLEALAWGHLANLRSRDRKHEAALEAARTALERWQQHDPGAKETAVARLRLGHVMLRLAEGRIEDNSAGAKEILTQAANHLQAAREELLAFGAACASEAQTCLELEDFARRLSESLPNDEK